MEEVLIGQHQELQSEQRGNRTKHGSHSFCLASCLFSPLAHEGQHFPKVKSHPLPTTTTMDTHKQHQWETEARSTLLDRDSTDPDTCLFTLKAIWFLIPVCLLKFAGYFVSVFLFFPRMMLQTSILAFMTMQEE